MRLATLRSPRGNMRKIIHVDMDCFFAAVEVRDNPELAGKPVAVGGPSDSRGVICAANYEARKFGVHSALSTTVALRRCPELRLIYPNMQKYAEVSKKIRAIFHRFTDQIEPLSLDEAYLDVTGLPWFHGSASLLAQEIRRQIFEETGLTASAGIAPNKFLAKVAGNWNKPNGQFAVTPAMVDGFVADLPVENIWGVGKVTAEKIHNLGIKTCGQLQGLSQTELVSHFGSFGYFLYDICRGIDHREVVTSRVPKSLSVERTFDKDLASLEDCLATMPKLFDHFNNRSKGRFAGEGQNNLDTIKTLFIKIKFYDFTHTTVESPLSSTCKMITPENFTKLLKKGYERKSVPVRLIGIGVRFKGKPERKYRVDERQLVLF